MWRLFIMALVLLIHLAAYHHAASKDNERFISREQASKLTIVFIYYMSEDVCKDGMPQYIATSLDQAVRTQSHANVYFVANYIDCSVSWKKFLPTVKFVDTSLIMSSRSEIFKSFCLERFQRERGELWMTSALRFFLLEDFMRYFSIAEVLHLEADNMLYLDMTLLLPALQKYYTNIAVTPLSRDGLFATASVLWVPSFEPLRRLNNVFRQIVKTNYSKPELNLVRWKNYTDWLRGFPHACCKLQGIEPDEDGMGIKPFAINEMSMLAYYRFLWPERLLYLPVLPTFNFTVNVVTGWNSTAFVAGGSEVGEATGVGIWDSGSWGQYLGGTAKKSGRNRRFTDPSHIIGYALRQHEVCIPQFMCASKRELLNFNVAGILRGANSSDNDDACVTAPFVKCDANSSWTPIINLHVHSKHTDDFKSSSCDCSQ
jgi:hypothetical protein